MVANLGTLKEMYLFSCLNSVSQSLLQSIEPMRLNFKLSIIFAKDQRKPTDGLVTFSNYVN